MGKKLIAPLRIDFAGGWIDLPDFSKIYPGYVVNASIKPHIKFEDKEVDFGVYKPGGGVASSTGAIILTALKLITDHSIKAKVYSSPIEFAENIYKWENSMLNFKIGRQDQYAISLGGLNCFRYGNHGFNISDFEVETHISKKTSHIKELEQKILLVHSGVVREAQSLVEIVRKNIASNEKKYKAALKNIAESGEKAARAVQNGKLEELGEIMNENWDAQKRFAPEASSTEMDYIYSEIMKNGALGGKICGAGGGGYFVFYCTDREKVKRKAKEMNLQIIVPEFEMRDILTLNKLNPTG